jgi:hypothetical protein
MLETAMKSNSKSATMRVPGISRPLATVEEDEAISARPFMRSMTAKRTDLMSTPFAAEVANALFAAPLLDTAVPAAALATRTEGLLRAKGCGQARGA